MESHSLGLELALAFTPDGQFLLSSDQLGISIWDVKQRTLFKGLTNHLEQVTALALSADGHLLASAGSDQTIKLWNTANWNEIVTLRGHESEMFSVAFSPDGQRLVSSGKDENHQNLGRPLIARESEPPATSRRSPPAAEPRPFPLSGLERGPGDSRRRLAREVWRFGKASATLQLRNASEPHRNYLAA